MIENNDSPIVSKNQLIDILYTINTENVKTTHYGKVVNKESLNSIIDFIIELESESEEVYCFKDVMIFDPIIKTTHGLDFSKEFMSTYFFNIGIDKYIYILSTQSCKEKNVESEIRFVISQLDLILNNKLNEGNKNNWLRETRSEYVNILNKYIEQNKTITEKLKEYDYIKIISDNNKYYNINITDIEKCLEFLKENEQYNYLTIDEEIILKLIIIYGIRNIYYNNTDYYKEQYSESINKVIKNLESYILFIETNSRNVKDMYLYSNNYDASINLFEYLNREKVYGKMLIKDDQTNYFTNKDIIIELKEVSFFNRWSVIYQNEFIILIKNLRYIYFDYCVSNNFFEKAKEVFKKDLELFKYFKDNNCNAEDMYKEVLNNTENKLIEFKRYMKLILKYYISCYNYFKHFSDINNANKAFDFLQFFKNGYDIEDFIIKCKYIKMSEDVNNIKLENIDDIDEVEKTINNINEKITKMNLVNLFDIDDVIKTYSNINFENFRLENRERIKTYIATGDKIMNSFNNDYNDNFDYSSAVIEWSKAVELEINEKLISVLTENDKYKIENYSKEINQDNLFRSSHPFILNLKDATIGTFDAIKKYKLQNYLYNEFFSKIYIFDKETYNNLCNYLVEIVTPRNNSAHKDNPINLVTAIDCKEKILTANKILEILSKLERIN